MTTFTEFIRKLPALPKDKELLLEREQWNMLVGDHLVGLYRTLYKKPLPYLSSEDVDYVDSRAEGLLHLHLAYDWTFADGRIAHASVLALDGVPVCAWRRQGRDDDLDALIVLEPNIASRLARWVFDLAGRHLSTSVQNTTLDVNAWLWEGNEHLAPAASKDTFFYTVVQPSRLTPISQVVTEKSYVPTSEGALLPIYGLGALQPTREKGWQGLAAMAHTTEGPRSVDVQNLVHSVLPLESMRGEDLDALQQRLAKDDYWFIQECLPEPSGWTCVVAVHRRGRLYFQWHILHWPAHCKHKMVQWSHRIGEHQPGAFNAHVLASMGLQLGE